MLCPHCSQDIPLNQQYCPICGKKVEVDFDQIESSVAADNAERRTNRLESILLNTTGALVVLWVGLILYNQYYRQDKLPGDRSASICFPAPQPEVRDDSKLDFKLTVPTVAVPQLQKLEPRGMSWRRPPFRDKLRDACAGDQSRDAAACISKGLDFLKSQQQKDGSWLVLEETNGDYAKTDWGRCGVTALACLAFLADGHAWNADDKDPYANTVKKGIGYLVASQDASGRFGTKQPPAHYMYNHGMATAAVAEAYAMTGEPALRVSAQKGVNYILSVQQRTGGWDYYEEPATRSDTSVSAWQLMALYSARQAGLTVPSEAFEKGMKFIDSLTNPASSRVGYSEPWKEGVGNGSTAISLMLQLYFGRSPASATAAQQAKLLKSESMPDYNPKWTDDQKASKVDYYTIYHATMAFQRLGGTDWTAWNAKLVPALKAAQDSQGCWPVDKWSRQGGKVYSTSLAILALESYYRYQ